MSRESEIEIAALCVSTVLMGKAIMIKLEYRIFI